MVNFLKIDAETSLAYQKSVGRSPGVMFLGGFMSDMNGTKAMALDAFCRERKQAYVRFDYQGHGQSSGEFSEGTISQWVTNALAIFDQVTEGPQILVGSSMGGWIALLLALQRPERVKALIGIAAAPDFTEDLMWEEFSSEQQAQLLREGVIYISSEYDAPYPVTKNLIEDGKKNLLLNNSIPLDAPIHLLHGMQDKEVPWQRSILLTEKVQASQIKITLIKDGDHRLAREQDLEVLMQSVTEYL